MSDVTNLLAQLVAGDSVASDKLLPLVYDELRKLAAAKLAHERPGQTLQPTALVHDAYVRLVQNNAQHWDGERHFFAAAAEAMRRILIENARKKESLKRGGHQTRQPLGDLPASEDADVDELLALDEALTRLAAADPLAAQLVHLRYFAGLTMDQAAETLGISPRSAYYTWNYARSWLRKSIRGEDNDPAENP